MFWLKIRSCLDSFMLSFHSFKHLAYLRVSESLSKLYLSVYVCITKASWNTYMQICRVLCLQSDINPPGGGNKHIAGLQTDKRNTKKITNWADVGVIRSSAILAWSEDSVRETRSTWNMSTAVPSASNQFVYRRRELEGLLSENHRRTESPFQPLHGAWQSSLQHQVTNAYTAVCNILSETECYIITL